MDRRSNNIAIFQDSMDLIKANQKLQQAVQSFNSEPKAVCSIAGNCTSKTWKITLQNDCFI